MNKYKSCLEKAKNKKLCARGYCTAKSKYAVYPSAYANGYASQVCNGTKPDFENQIRNDYGDKKRDSSSDLTRWYEEEWVNVCETDINGKYLPCGRSTANLKANNYPYCRPLHKLKGTPVKSVNELSKSELAEMCRRKKSITPGVNGAPTKVYVSDLLIENPLTRRLVKADGKLGRVVQSGGGGGGGGKMYLPKMTLVEEYNKDKSKQTKRQYNGESVTLYAPELSDSRLKKLKVYVQDSNTGAVKRIDFGHTDYEDYTIHRDNSRRDSYCARSNGITCRGKPCSVDSANYWSRMVLWNCPP
jgi:hypothetical protein